MGGIKTQSRTLPASRIRLKKTRARRCGRFAKCVEDSRGSRAAANFDRQANSDDICMRRTGKPFSAGTLPTGLCRNSSTPRTR